MNGIQNTNARDLKPEVHLSGSDQIIGRIFQVTNTVYKTLQAYNHIHNTKCEHKLSTRNGGKNSNNWMKNVTTIQH